ARQRMAMRPSRMSRASSGPGRPARDPTPFGPPCEWTSIETLSRSNAVAAASVASDAQGASPDVAAHPATIPAPELHAALPIHWRRVIATPQQVMVISSLLHGNTAEIHVQLGQRGEAQHARAVRVDLHFLIERDDRRPVPHLSLEIGEESQALLRIDLTA